MDRVVAMALVSSVFVCVCACVCGPGSLADTPLVAPHGKDLTMDVVEAGFRAARDARRQRAQALQAVQAAYDQLFPVLEAPAAPTTARFDFL
jgi:hypothetical protein